MDGTSLGVMRDGTKTKGGHFEKANSGSSLVGCQNCPDLPLAASHLLSSSRLIGYRDHHTAPKSKCPIGSRSILSGPLKTSDGFRECGIAALISKQ